MVAAHVREAHKVPSTSQTIANYLKQFFRKE
ncbi:MAG: hypothetical protein M3179_11485 [Actinomycetota bacterium]|nr:hypothetical protein [Actinomycetota bacterium]